MVASSSGLVIASI